MAVSDDPADVEAVEGEVGHPGDKWDALKERVQAASIAEFGEVEADWLDLMWTLDAYRRHAVVPRGMGSPGVVPGRRLAAIYRGKGNWYAELIALLLGVRTSQTLAPRTRVEGFSQLHQVDVAWPDRYTRPIRDPLICLETKVTGAPPYGKTKARGAMDDWSNRRKELKFAATDLKLAHRGSTTEIDHWDEWRLDQMPLCYFVWGARLRPEDDVARMVREVQALTKTYLDGAGLFAWREKASSSRYIRVNVVTSDPSDRVSTIDDMLRRVAARIKKLAPRGAPPPPVPPADRPVDPRLLLDDDAAD